MGKGALSCRGATWSAAEVTNLYQLGYDRCLRETV